MPSSSRLYKPRYPLGPLGQEYLKKLAGCRFPVGKYPKHFVRDLQGATEMTEGQFVYFLRLVYSYREQLRIASSVQTVLEQLQQERYPLPDKAEETSVEA